VKLILKNYETIFPAGVAP